MQVHVEIGNQRLPVRMRMGAMRHQRLRAMPSLQVPGVMRVLTIATMGIQFMRVRRVAPKLLASAAAAGD